jgi:hypothetical protein
MANGKKTNQINVTLPEYWDELLSEMSKLTGESVSSIAARAVILYLGNAISTGLVNKLRDESEIDKSAE